MNRNKSKLKKGGMDTIIAYIVVMLPLLYVLIYMVATIYHFSVQMYMNQVVKEATVMASTYGEITQKHVDYIHGKLKDVLGEENGKAKCTINFYRREFVEDGDNAGTVKGIESYGTKIPEVSKADIIGIQVISTEESILGSVTSFGIFNGDNGYSSDNALKYTAYREEIIRNDKKYTP